MKTIQCYPIIYHELSDSIKGEPHFLSGKYMLVLHGKPGFGIILSATMMNISESKPISKPIPYSGSMIGWIHKRMGGNRNIEQYSINETWNKFRLPKLAEGHIQLSPFSRWTLFQPGATPLVQSVHKKIVRSTNIGTGETAVSNETGIIIRW